MFDLNIKLFENKENLWSISLDPIYPSPISYVKLNNFGSTLMQMFHNFLVQLEIPLLFITGLIGILIGVAFFTLVERQILGIVQRRTGPTTIGIYGLLQPIADGFKLLVKESIFPNSSNKIIFIFSPVFTFTLAIAIWVVIPFGQGGAIADVNLGLLYLFIVSSLSVHSVILAGWSSNSKYAFLGALRSAAQMISYELALGLCILCVLVCSGTLNLTDIVYAQKNHWFIWPLLPIFLVFFICTLAETNRHPFDLPEAEAELVSGYNVEYSAMGFALFFLAEYSNILVMCLLTVLFFLGGWYWPFDFVNHDSLFGVCFSAISLSIKSIIFIVLFVVLRATLPRYRYDQLMRLCWKVFLPLTLIYFTLLVTILVVFNGLSII